MVQLHGCTHVSCDALQLHSAGELGSVPGVHTRTVTHSASNSFPECHILQSIRARVLVGLELPVTWAPGRLSISRAGASGIPSPPAGLSATFRLSSGLQNENFLHSVCASERRLLFKRGLAAAPPTPLCLAPPTSEELFSLDRCDVVISDMASHPNWFNQSGDEYSTLLRGFDYLHLKGIHKCHVAK